MQSKNNCPPLCPFDSSSQGSPHSARPAAPLLCFLHASSSAFLYYFLIYFHLRPNQALSGATRLEQSDRAKRRRQSCLVLLTSIFLFLFPLVTVVRGKTLPQKAEVHPIGFLKPMASLTVYIYTCSFCTAIGALLYVKNATSTVAHEVLNTTTLTIKGKLHWATRVLFDLPKAQHAACCSPP